MPLTKTDLIAAVAAHTGSTSKEVATVLAGIEDVVVANVAKGEKVVITGFLTFDRAQRAARTGRNPQTGETIKIKASKSPKVSAGASFKKVVNGKARPGFRPGHGTATGPAAVPVPGTVVAPNGWCRLPCRSPARPGGRLTAGGGRRPI